MSPRSSIGVEHGHSNFIGSAGDLSRVWSMAAMSSAVRPTLRHRAASASPRRTRFAGSTARSRISRILASALWPCRAARTRSARCTSALDRFLDAQLPRDVGQQRLDPGQPGGVIGLGVGDTHDRQLVAVLAGGEIGNPPLDRAQPGLHGRETMTGLALQQLCRRNRRLCGDLRLLGCSDDQLPIRVFAHAQFSIVGGQAVQYRPVRRAMPWRPSTGGCAVAWDMRLG